MNPVVLIATHKRLQITSQNLDSLLAQTVKPEIILVVSEREELSYYRAKYPEVHVIIARNEPLGDKWQTGVVFASTLKPNPLIITGSDDILGNTFVENACRLVEEGNHFVGLQRCWFHNQDKAYLCDYMALQPLGSGRVYSAVMLEKLEYKLFDISRGRHLDDAPWNRARGSTLKVSLIHDVEKEGLEIHAIKGDWPVMNRFDLKHKNIKLIRAEKWDDANDDFAK